MARPLTLLTCGLAVCLLAVPGTSGAQEGAAAETPPAHIAYTDGRVLLEYDASSEDVEANTPLMPGDRVRTDAGRAEIVFGDGSVVHLDEHTTIDLLSDRLVRLLAGRLALTVGTGLANQLQIDAAAGSVRPTSAGEYRVSLLAHGGGADLELAVIRGTADLFTEADAVALAAGQRAVADVRGTFAGPWPFNSAALDAFGQWSLARLDARRGASSYGYIPAEVRHYAGDFDRYGAWSHEPAYGYVWYPRVAVGWRPYYHGRWRHYPRWGWTWVGGPRWTWPTHHYGRWGVSSGGAWFWIPGRQWSGAWVHWGVAANYVSWCPLGFNNRPVFGFWTHGHRYRHDPWRAWTVVHRSHFGARRGVHAVALDGHRVVTTQRASFVTQDAPPAFRGAHTRRIADGSAAGSLGYAVPRENPRSAGRARTGTPDRGGQALSVIGAQPAARGSGRGIRTGTGYAVRRDGATAAAPSGIPTPALTEPVRRRHPRAVATVPPSPTGNSPEIDRDVSTFRRRATPSVSRSAPEPSPWRATDVPVYRGGQRDEGASPGSGAVGRPGVRRGGAVPQSPGAHAPVEAPRSDAGTYAPRMVPDGTARGGTIAVPRGRSGETPTYSPPARTDGAGRGSSSPPPGRLSAPAAPAPSGGGGGRRAGGGSEGGATTVGTAVRRGGSGGAESASGRSGGGRSRR